MFNLHVGGPIPFHISSFRLGSKREYAVNVDLAVTQSHNAVINWSYDTPPVKAYGLVTDSPNVMLKARKLSCGLDSSGSGFVTFAYGFVCNALYLRVKDTIKLPIMNVLFKSRQVLWPITIRTRILPKLNLRGGGAYNIYYPKLSVHFRRQGGMDHHWCFNWFWKIGYVSEHYSRKRFGRCGTKGDHRPHWPVSRKRQVTLALVLESGRHADRE